MELDRLLAELPDEATVPVGWLRRQLAAAGASASGRLADLTVTDVAEELGRAPSTIRTWCGEGRLRGAYRLRGREWRIPPAAIRALRSTPPRDSDDGGTVDLGAWRREAGGE